jgi:TatD DNase family protein
MTYVDAHGHFADTRLDSAQDLRRKAMLDRAREKKISILVQGGVGPEDWRRQQALAVLYPEVVPVFGLHPYWVHGHSEADCENALDELARLAAKSKAIGEMGLDLRPQYADSEGLQLEMFSRQLELARFANKPVVLHVVQAHEQALRVLSTWGLPVARGMVHAFNGSAKKAQEFLSLGLFISVGGALCRTDNTRLHQAVQSIPLQFLLLETDTPDQPPPGIASGENEPSTLFAVAEQMAKIKGLTTLEILDRTSQNARKLFSL